MWIGDLNLADLFPAFFKLSRNKNDSIRDMFSFTDAIPAWNFNFSRTLNDNEVILVTELLQLISNPVLTNSGEDSLTWRHGNTFSIKSCYNAIEEEGFIRFPHMNIWNPRIPQKVSFCTWCLCYNSAPTLDTLRNRIVINGCILCWKAAESNTHLFLHYEETMKLWHFFFNSFNLVWVFREDVKANIWEWSSKKGNSLKQRLWGLIPSAIWWTVWNERNNRIFMGKFKNSDQILQEVKILLYHWSIGTNTFAGFTLNTVLHNWNVLLGSH